MDGPRGTAPPQGISELLKAWGPLFTQPASLFLAVWVFTDIGNGHLFTHPFWLPLAASPSTTLEVRLPQQPGMGQRTGEPGTSQRTGEQVCPWDLRLVCALLAMRSKDSYGQAAANFATLEPGLGWLSLGDNGQFGGAAAICPMWSSSRLGRGCCIPKAAGP